MEVAGKGVLLAGGAGAIGQAVTANLLRRSARIAVLDSDPDGARHFSDAAIAYFHADGADEQAVAQAVPAAVAALGTIHVLVNCMGAMHSEPLIKLAD
ncbi:MAG: Enoyl-(Acyl carrier protein) reductase, partial [Candidatus Eremiobacteraeota bacterium]|nr:Enoyl-(Acyl carrier protein) reductase [Candidatus Eremiobacteraeota bacterium]